MLRSFRVLDGPDGRFFVVNGEVFETDSAEAAQQYADDMNAAESAGRSYAALAFERDPSLRYRVSRYPAPS